MSRITLGIVGFILIAMGVLTIWGHAANGSTASGSLWHAWLITVVGVLILIIAVSDKPVQK